MDSKPEGTDTEARIVSFELTEGFAYKAFFPEIETLVEGFGPRTD